MDLIKQSKRIAYIDAAKAICIFLMVVGHWISNDMLIKYIYSFHMPALFIISGYLYKPRPWYKTILSFGIPVAFFSLVNLCFLVATHEKSVSSLFSKELFFSFFHYRYGLGKGLYVGDWFIWALLALRFLFGDIQIMKVFRRNYYYLVILAILYMSFESYLIEVDTLVHGWFWGRALPSLPFFCFGLYLKDKGWCPEKMSVRAISVLFLIFMLLPIINGNCSINDNEYGLSYVVFLLNAIGATLFLFFVSTRIKSTKAIILFSKGTLLILGLHMPIMIILDMIFPPIFHDLLPLLVLPICYYPILLLDRWCPELLGKIRWNI